MKRRKRSHSRKPRPFPKLRAYIALTKPSILLLVLVTGAAGLALEGSLAGEPLRFALVLLFLAMSGGAANAFNEYFERDIDARMERTRRRRPLPQNKISPAGAFIFAAALTMASTAGFYLYFNPLSAAMALGTVLFYSLFYTLYLKPRTPLNIVIGGAAGSMAPVIAWSAAAGSVSIEPLLMFAIIFFWTPPHFWSLALCLKDDYRKAKLPMLPLLLSDRQTWVRIMAYTIMTLVLSLTMGFFGMGWFYLTAASVLGVLFLRAVITGMSRGTLRTAWGAFGYSIIYLLALFVAMAVDGRFL